MSRFLIFTTALQILLFTILGLIHLPQGQPAAHVEILLPDASCAAPCWWGIQVADEDKNVPTRLNQLPYARDGVGSKEFSTDGERFFTSYVIVSTRSDRVMQVMLDVYGMVTLGELFLQLGSPDCVRLARAHDIRLIFLYRQAKVEIFTDAMTNSERLVPTTPIRSVYYHPGTPDSCADWQGFTWLARYLSR